MNYNIQVEPIFATIRWLQDKLTDLPMNRHPGFLSLLKEISPIRHDLPQTRVVMLPNPEL